MKDEEKDKRVMEVKVRKEGRQKGEKMMTASGDWTGRKERMEGERDEGIMEEGRERRRND